MSGRLFLLFIQQLREMIAFHRHGVNRHVRFSIGVTSAATLSCSVACSSTACRPSALCHSRLLSTSVAKASNYDASLMPLGVHHHLSFPSCQREDRNRFCALLGLASSHPQHSAAFGGTLSIPRMASPWLGKGVVFALAEG